MKYIVYKITNSLNNKYYIGVHKTENIYDSYMGSGKAIKNAIKKYGLQYFKKEIIESFDNSIDAYCLERNLTENYYLSNNYNMKLGGVGGFTKESQNKGLKLIEKNRKEYSKMGGISSKILKTGIFSLDKETHLKNSSCGGKANKENQNQKNTEEKFLNLLKIKRT